MPRPPGLRCQARGAAYSRLRRTAACGRRTCTKARTNSEVSGVTIGRQGWQNATGPRPRGPGPRGHAAPDTSVYPDPEQPQQGTSKNQSEPYFSVNNIASSPYVTDKGFHEAKDQTALAMSKQIIKSINDKNIPLNKCRGQGYDGANTMEGTGGVQKLIKDIEPNAVCVHCAAHNLNLVLNDASGREIDALQAERLGQSCLSVTRSALSFARSAQAERDNESCFFVPAAGVHRLIRRYHVKNDSRVGRVRPLPLFYSDASADGVEKRSLVPRALAHTLGSGGMPRKIANNKPSTSGKNNGTSSSSSCDSSDKQPLTVMYFWKSIALTACLAVVITATSLGYLETRVNTPFSSEKVVEESGLAVPHRYWGSYRPGVYFGMKTRDPQSPVFGLMWYQPASAHRGIRHWCEQGDNLPSYGWIRHDGITFGEQIIEDPPHTLRTSFIKTLSGDYGGHWTARIEVNSTNDAVPLSLIWYVALDESMDPMEGARLWVDGGALAGHTPATNNFRINFHVHKGKVLHTSHAKAHASGLHLLKEKVYSLLQVARHKTLGHHVILTSDEDLHLQDKGVNFVAYQFLIESPIVLDVVYSKEMSTPLQGKSYDEALEEKRKMFDKKFEDKFSLSQRGSWVVDGVLGTISYQVRILITTSELTNEFEIKLNKFASCLTKHAKFSSGHHCYSANGCQQSPTCAEVLHVRLNVYAVYSDEDVSAARAAMSNMVGGIGYFYGSSRVQSQHNREPVPYWKAPLYTAVPSRSFFPRGFLWDEGFHGLLISKWNPDIQMDIVAHWLDLTNVEGWIPREQILGEEALARVPSEYVVQNNAVANPPMLLIQIAHMVETRPQLFGNHSPHRRTLERMYTRLQTWYNWFLISQKGTEWSAFRWRGRVDDGLQLNPKTLASGLDDYPRASHPSKSERHVDLRCWMYAAADAMITIGQALQLDVAKTEILKFGDRPTCGGRQSAHSPTSAISGYFMKEHLYNLLWGTR
ncbi:Mannosyl-oligosaccharide glucosidase GCS1 [Eumeta japonica]|uniref:Mannosyl-oligosaccharide glucosidase n=1 Tax=Eumeta variegata TaxID=151549 RepID=A0A4C1WMS7_EUMVA|nr:Mannosyl-oligosaccharide glucosidase GCS1 [Eumeta japonica]